MNENGKYMLETRLSGTLFKSYGMVRLIPITRDNICTLKPGDWIWDDKPVERRVHKRSIYEDKTVEPIGFRQIHILDIEGFIKGCDNKPFSLSDFDSDSGGYNWVFFEENRFYKI